MKGGALFDALGRSLGTSTQRQLAAAIGMDEAYLSLRKATTMTARMAAGLVARQVKQLVRWPDLLDDLKKRLGTSTDEALALKLGVSRQTLDNWRNAGAVTLKGASALVMKAAKAAQADAHDKAIRPIIEFFPIEAFTKKSKTYVFDDGASAGKQRHGIKEELRKTHGLYIFYDALGRALYVGQAKTSIWSEMNSAFDRDRNSQKISVVKHPTRNVGYRSASEKLRQPTDTQRRLHEIAAFFSAYEVADELIDNFEALFIRAFPNDLLNYKIEKIKRRAKASRIRKGK